MQLFEAFVQLIGEAPAERQHTQFVLQLKELELLKAMPLSSCQACSRSYASALSTADSPAQHKCMGQLCIMLLSVLWI